MAGQEIHRAPSRREYSSPITSSSVAWIQITSCSCKRPAGNQDLDFALLGRCESCTLHAGRKVSREFLL